MPTPIFGVELKGGKLHFDRPAEFSAHIHSLKPGRYELTVRRRGQKRGSAANRYYFGVVVKLIAEAVGDEPESVHEDLARKFLTVDPDAPLPKRRSTAELDSAEFARYVDDCRRFASTFLGVVVPGPGEVE